MPLIDRSPGAFIAFAFVVVYFVIGVEVWMWTVASTAAIAVTFVFITGCAAVICRAAFGLMDDGPLERPVPARVVVPTTEAARVPMAAPAFPPVAEPVTVPQPEAAPTTARRPQPVA